MKKQDNKLDESAEAVGRRTLDAEQSVQCPVSSVRRLTQVGLTGLFLWATGLTNALLAQSTALPETPRQCAAELVERQLQQRLPNRRLQADLLNEQVRAFGALKQGGRGAQEVVYRIPVVVHVIHSNRTNTIGGANNANISDEQILSQIQVLNEDYRKIAGTLGGSSTNPLAVDTGIEFFLATTDPSGQPTSGITRTYSAKTQYNVVESADLLALAALIAWPTNQYLNIWVCNNSNTGYLGYGQFPTASASDITGANQFPYTDERIDGLAIDYRFFGRTGAVTSQLYGLGRTATHEIGHWLGLFHPNGDTYCGDDFVADTPPTESLNNIATVNCNPVYSNCSGVRTRNLIEDYMDYTPDPCMNVFTGGQRDRMRAVLELSPRRRQVVQSATTLTSTEQLTLTVYPNPISAGSEGTVNVQFQGTQPFTAALIDVTGRQVYSRLYAASSSSRISVPTGGLSAGLYFIRVTTATETATKRILIR